MLAPYSQALEHLLTSHYQPAQTENETIEGWSIDYFGTKEGEIALPPASSPEKEDKANLRY